ncbi:MAG: class I SAM-dependent methyltransferase [Acidimicrobiales bacterium]|nr:class I SAM-dependent methyltransferase [Acidimicrobiales bacterium]
MPEAELHAYYERDEERDRLASGLGLVEFLRTTEVITRRLPPTGATIADIGGGPGRYTDWLVHNGHRVVHRDLVPLHVDHVRAAHGDLVDTAVGDARSLDLADASVDAVLLLGPLYHLEQRRDRVTALREARRIVRPGGYVYAAAISRWAPRLHGMLIDHVHVKYPPILSMIEEAERSGEMPPVHESAFNGFAHRPEQLREELVDAGFTIDGLVCLEGVAFMLGDLAERLADPDERSLLFDTLRATESVAELLGLGPHLLAVGHKLQ